MNRMIALLWLAALMACTDDNVTEPEMPPIPEAAPAFAIQTQSAGGLTMVNGSGCAVDASSNFTCSFRASGLPAGPANALANGYWLVKFRCVDPATGKSTPRLPPAYGEIQGWTITHDQVDSVNGEVWARNVQVTPPSESSQAEFLCQSAPFTELKYVSSPKPTRWRIMVDWALDVNHYYVEISETL